MVVAAFATSRSLAADAHCTYSDLFGRCNSCTSRCQHDRQCPRVIHHGLLRLSRVRYHGRRAMQPVRRAIFFFVCTLLAADVFAGSSDTPLGVTAPGGAPESDATAQLILPVMPAPIVRQPPRL